MNNWRIKNFFKSGYMKILLNLIFKNREPGIKGWLKAKQVKQPF